MLTCLNNLGTQSNQVENYQLNLSLVMKNIMLHDKINYTRSVHRESNNFFSGKLFECECLKLSMAQQYLTPLAPCCSLHSLHLLVVVYYTSVFCSLKQCISYYPASTVYVSVTGACHILCIMMERAEQHYCIKLCQKLGNIQSKTIHNTKADFWE